MRSISHDLRYIVYSSLFAAFIAAGAFIAIPIGPVPIVLQNMFVILAGLCLGRNWGAIAVLIYFLAGTIGLPVFAGGTGGISRFWGPTGGYLISYLPSVYIIGFMSEKFSKNKFSTPVYLLSSTIGTAVVYLMGVSWLMYITGMTLSKSITVGMYPFLIGDALKIIAAALLTHRIKLLLPLKTN